MLIDKTKPVPRNWDGFIIYSCLTLFVMLLVTRPTTGYLSFLFPSKGVLGTNSSLGMNYFELILIRKDNLMEQ